MSDRPASRVARFDAAVDDLFDPLRGHAVPDRVFEVASHLGDWSLVWILITTAQALRSDDDLRRTPRIVATLAAESLLVNQGIKRLFNRGRPRDRPAVSDRLRVPLTSSFPSGHASSAVCAAVVLTEGDPALRWLVWPAAALVATSRIYTRMHHPSDVAAGALTGLVLGKAIVALRPDPHRHQPTRRP